METHSEEARGRGRRREGAAPVPALLLLLSMIVYMILLMMLLQKLWFGIHSPSIYLQIVDSTGAEEESGRRSHL
jgi:hypothetical protein